MNILNILLGILLFFLIILVHEFGHFTVAKLCKMKVKEFAIGMGPKLFKKRIGETVFAFKALPIGGSTRTLKMMTRGASETGLCG